MEARGDQQRRAGSVAEERVERCSRRDARKKTRFLAAIEPWHGNIVAVYTESGAK